MNYFIVYDSLEVETFDSVGDFTEGVHRAIGSGKKFLCFVGNQVLFNADGSLMSWGSQRVFLNSSLLECNLTQPPCNQEKKDG